MKKTGSFLGLILGICINSSPLLAANIKTKISQDKVKVGDVFTVSVEVRFKDGLKPDLSIYEVPKDPLISFLQQSTSQSYSTITRNGVTETKKIVALNMVFFAKSKGTATISQVKLRINNKVFAAKGFKIEIVAKNSKSQNQAQNNQVNSIEDMLNNFFGNQSGRDFGFSNQAKSDLDFFVDVETSTMNPYYSEQFVAKWYLYTNGRVTDIDTLKYPALQGFWKDEILLATSLTPESVRRGDKVYTRYLLASYAITPIVNEQAFIDPYEVKCQLVGGFFSFGSKEFVRKSDEVLIKIKPLPLDRPPGFTGAVGDFKVSGFIQDRSFKVGQPFTYILRVQGKGQLKFMELPDLSLEEDSFTIYDIAEESQFKPPERSIRTYKILVVPQKPGELVLPEVEFFFFDPKKSEFYSANTKSIQVSVDEGDNIQQDIVSVDKSSLKAKFQPQLFSKVSGSPIAFTISSFYSYAACFIALFFSLGFVFISYLKSQVVYDFDKDIKHRFDALEALINSNEWRQASIQAVNIVYFFANAKSKKKPRSQRLDDILIVLPVGLRRGIETTIRSLNADLQKYSFAPESLIENTDIKAKVLEKCLALKELLERSSKDDF